MAGDNQCSFSQTTSNREVPVLMILLVLTVLSREKQKFLSLHPEWS